MGIVPFFHEFNNIFYDHFTIDVFSQDDIKSGLLSFVWLNTIKYEL